MIDMYEAMRAIMPHRKDDIVITTETSIPIWEDATALEGINVGASCMGKGSSLALGIALANPERRVIVWDGDGGLLMNLGTLVTIADAAPKNLHHIVLDNGMYAMTGGQPVPNQGKTNFTQLAKAAGYANAFMFDNLEDWTTGIGDILSKEGPNLILMDTVPLVTDEINRKFRPPQQPFKTFVSQIRSALVEKN